MEKIFLENAEVAMEPAKAVQEYKEQIVSLESKVDEYAKTVGNLTVELEWTTKLANSGCEAKFPRKKLKSLDSILKLIHLVLIYLRISSNKRDLVESKLKEVSLSRQCELLSLSRGSIYYKPVINKNKEAIKNKIVEIFEEIPIYGYLKVHQQLLEYGFNVSANTVQTYRKELNLKAVLAVKAPNTSAPNKQHTIYSYKLKGLDITHANQVWSTDITYIKIKGGMVYMAAIIDWYSKAVLSWRISNTMDSTLVMDVLNEALSLYGKPEIFNTDQGSQYTSYIHTQTLKDNGIEISMDGKGEPLTISV